MNGKNDVQGSDEQENQSGAAFQRATDGASQGVSINNSTNINVTDGRRLDSLLSFGAPDRASTPPLQLTDVKCNNDDYLDLLPFASSYTRKLDSSYLILDSRHRGMVFLASRALCRSLVLRERDSRTACEVRCKTAVLEDTAFQPLRDAVSREKPDVLLLHLTHERLLEGAISFGSSIHMSGVKVIIAAPEERLGNWRHSKINLWSLNSSDELLEACEADETLRRELKESQTKQLWPNDEHALANALAHFIVEGGLHEVRRNLLVSQEQNSAGALKLVEEAAKRGEDGVVDRALLFVVSHFPKIPVAEIDSLLVPLLAEEEIEVPNKHATPVTPKANEPAEPPPPAFIPMAATEYWRKHRRDILTRNGLKARPGTDQTTILDFPDSSWGARVKEMLDPWDVQELMKKLHDAHLLLNPWISTAATNGLIAATAALFVSAPSDYDANWLVRQVAGVSMLKELYASRGLIQVFTESDDPYSIWSSLDKVFVGHQQLSKLLFERLANLCWNIMGHRTDTVRQFIDKLSSESKFGARGSMALEIVLRLRSQQRANSAAFDAWSWLRHLLATSGSRETCSEVVAQLVDDAKASAISTWQTLTRVMEWLRPEAEWTDNDAIQTWTFSFLYVGFHQDIDRHFFIDDQEGIPPWTERKSYLLRWMTHPGFARAMDTHFRNRSATPAWLRRAPESVEIVLNGEICIAELLDYWYFHAPGVDGASCERVKELIGAVNDHTAALPRRTENPPRPERRAIWLGLRTLNSIWGYHAMNLPTKPLRDNFRQRRDSAYALAQIFR